jgi:hypothetical protein
MCGSEPCAHERGDAITSFVAQTRALVAVTAERDAALVALAHLRMEIHLLTIGPAHQHHAGKITPSQLCDVERNEEPTDQPKGKP